MVESTIAEVEGRLLARIESESMVFEVSADALSATDVTLHFLRDGDRVGSIYNDHGTEKTMAHLDTPGETDFVGVEVPKSFVEELLGFAEETGRIADDSGSIEGYRIRMLD
ncbi:hypothetical protein GJ629_08250 [Halapricum sp. CBA1109]|uniref:hypothetical protein n=1 Tax=Halapricum sp. CBA1109 TaxID=2668068 RepID=UPI0012F9BED4|nr:hypothetical protein [Halapricum sp. CBA1109]MUV89885.1 hypothetical protein [Halapricum sp. CBA1109]